MWSSRLIPMLRKCGGLFGLRSSAFKWCLYQTYGHAVAHRESWFRTLSRLKDLPAHAAPQLFVQQSRPPPATADPRRPQNKTTTYEALRRPVRFPQQQKFETFVSFLKQEPPDASPCSPGRQRPVQWWWVCCALLAPDNPLRRARVDTRTYS